MLATHRHPVLQSEAARAADTLERWAAAAAADQCGATVAAIDASMSAGADLVNHTRVRGAGPSREHHAAVLKLTTRAFERRCGKLADSRCGKRADSRCGSHRAERRSRVYEYTGRGVPTASPECRVHLDQVRAKSFAMVGPEYCITANAEDVAMLGAAFARAE